MSKYKITHLCGHNVEHSIVGTNVHGERERKAAWLASEPCPECKAAEKRQALEDASVGLPALVGTPPQVAWASDIRAKAVAPLTAARKAAEAAQAQSPMLATAALEVIAKTLATTDARYWIEQRAARFDLRWVGEQLPSVDSSPAYARERHDHDTTCL